jgi:photosystem II stability/assembly factor-like uncharacterized protein
MLRTSPAWNVHVYRTRLRALLLAVVTVVIAWSALSGYSAKRDEPSVRLNPRSEASLPTQKQPEGEKSAAIDKYYGNLPLSFEENRGQADASVKYIARGPGYSIFLTAAEAVFVLKDVAAGKSKAHSGEPEDVIGSHSQRVQNHSGEDEATEKSKAEPAVLRVRPEGANKNAGEVEGAEQLEGKVNYFMGNDSSKWLTDISTYRKVVYRDAYPGIDMVYYGNRQQLEYDFVVAPGADASVVALKYEGAQDIRVDREGNLILKTPAGELRQLKPVVYQEIDGKRKQIEGRYQVRGKNSVGFHVSRYDRSKPLVIDPILVYSSLVSSGGYAAAIAVDSNGFAYITGYAFGEINPTAGAFATLFAGDYSTFVTKINQAGTDVIYTTYIGGTSQSEAFGIAVDSGGNAYVTGYASGTFPTTPGSLQPVRASDFDCFITKLNSTGSALVYSTFYGGSEFEEGVAITVDGAGNAYVTGDSSSRNLVTTPGAIQTTNAGGTNGFLIRLNFSGSALGYATYLSPGGGFDLPVGVAVDSANNMYVAGETASFNFPQVNSLQGAGGVNRGIFRSINNGASWSLSNTGLSNSQVLSFAINRITTAIIYAGTVGGVYKTTNGGATWALTAPTNGAVRALAIDPTNTSIVYAGTSNGVYKTTNSGGSWTLINNGMFFTINGANYPIQVRTIAIDPTNPATIYAGSSLGLYKTTNGGASWINAGGGNGISTSQSIWSVVYDPLTPSTIYLGTNAGGVFKSTDSGANWTAVNTGLAVGNPRNVRSLAIVSNSPTTLYVGTLTGIFKTTDGGTNWTAVNNGLLLPYTDSVSRPAETINAIAIDPITPTTLYAGASNVARTTGAYPLTSILKSTDGGANWTAITNGFSSLNNGVLSLAINLSDPSLLYAGTAGDFDGFAAKINASGTSFTYSTFVGSSRNDYIASIAADSSGNSYLFGETAGTNFPVTAGAFDSTLGGSTDTFAMKLNASGTARLYSSYLGGSGGEDSYGLAVDSTGNAYVIGLTDSTDFPVTAGAFQTNIGGNGSAGTSDAFITKLNPSGTALVYSSYLGGAGGELGDFEGNNLALDPLGNAYVTGYTSDNITFPAFNQANPLGGPFGLFNFTFVAKIGGNTPTYSITGRLTTTIGNAPLAGIAVKATTAQGFSRSGTTDSQGYYSIISLPAGDYTVTPQAAGFTPASRTFNGLNSDQTANFSGVQGFDIAGRVTSSTNGRGVFDVTMTLGGAASATATTDASGNYVFRDLLPGDYTITPSKPVFTFSPINRLFTVSNADITGADFTTTSAIFFTISGHIVDHLNAAIPNTTVTIISLPQVGSLTEATQTDASGNYSFANLQAGGNYILMAAKAPFVFNPSSQKFTNLSANQVANFTGNSWQPAVLTAAQIAELKAWTVGGRTSVYVKPQFPDAGYRVTNWGLPTRVGNDFTVDASVEKFTGPSIQAAVTTAQIYDLGPLTNGTYNFNFKTSGTLAKTLQFIISSTVPPPNPIDDARTFVKQQYRDFLNREADPAGEDFWTDNITKCNDPARRPPGQTVEQCTLRQRETTSGAFFLSPEFQYTGYFVYRMYQGTLARPPKLSEFIPDAQFVGNGIIVGGQLSGAVINQNKAAFAAQFVNCVDATKSRCAEFKAIYDQLTNQQFVDKLFQTTGVNASASDRAALVAGLNGLTETRATVVQKVVDGINVISEGNQQFTTTYGQAFYNAELNRAFVQLEYFGYMRRDPDEAGFAFWLGKLNLFNGNFVNAEMVLAFISSPEYRARFGQP